MGMPSDHQRALIGMVVIVGVLALTVLMVSLLVRGG